MTNCPDGVDLQDHLKQLVARYDSLTAENVALKNVFGPGDAVLNFLTIALRHTTYDQIDLSDVSLAFQISLPETPATDSILRAAEARGRIEGINFAASRLAAAYNLGFIDKPLPEVFDVVRMILSAKEDLVTPGEDGLSGEYAEQALKDWEAELSEGKAE